MQGSALFSYIGRLFLVQISLRDCGNLPSNAKIHIYGPKVMIETPGSRSI